MGESSTDHGTKRSRRTRGSRQPDRRSFIESLGAGAVAAAAAQTFGAAALEGPAAEACDALGPLSQRDRREQALELRRAMAQLAHDRPLPDQICNGEEQDYPRVANFSKGLPHDAFGIAEREAYAALLTALAAGRHEEFEAVPLGLGRKLTNPLAGVAFDLEGPDGQHATLPPAPRIDGPENSAEMVELYWMALLRDVPFGSYPNLLLPARAAHELSGLSDFRGPKKGGFVTPRTLFRGSTPGDLVGPYVSQFLLLDIPYGSLTIAQRQTTLPAGLNYLTDYEDWLHVQNGGSTPPEARHPTKSYIRSGRDLAYYVRVDALYEAHLNACLILLGLGAPLDPGNPYAASATMTGFGTFGDPHVLSLVTEVATRALKAVWFQKWFVHRRLRPEEFGGRIHNHIAGRASYPIDSEVLDSVALQRILSAHGTALLPQAYADGCPTHPSYGAGHATVSGACTTILKAWFDESWVLTDPLAPQPRGNGLVPYAGQDADEITVGGELNKLAANISQGRNFAGIHWRSDYWESVRLGESIALGVLEEQMQTYSGDRASFTLTLFDGTRVTL